MERFVEIALHRRLSRIELRTELRLGRETLALVGPSGAGKTSVLRAIAGLLRPDDGRVAVGDRVWFDARTGIHLPPERRSAGVVFQDHALFPHLTVRQNVAFGARRIGATSRHDRAARVAGVLERFGIAQLADTKPRAISGGERQRVALARAVASEPDVLLLDEPLSALDPRTKAHVAGELDRHLHELGLPSILVSHDFADVVGLAGRIAVMEEGRIQQVGPPAELVQAPASPFVAALTGVNYFTGFAARHGDVTEVRSSTAVAGTLFLSTDPAVGPVGVVVYPWDVALSTETLKGSQRNALAGPVSRVAGVGNRIRVTVASRPVIVAEVTDEAMRALGIGRGTPVVASWKATGTRLIPVAGG
jgi:molybdate transport system ATP-binding protein